MKALTKMQPLRVAQAVAMASVMSPMVAMAALPPVAPDAGRLTRELQAPVQAPRPGAQIVLPDASRDVVSRGGQQVVLSGVTFTGVTVFTAAELSPLVQPAIGKSKDCLNM